MTVYRKFSSCASPVKLAPAILQKPSPASPPPQSTESQHITLSSRGQARPFIRQGYASYFKQSFSWSKTPVDQSVVADLGHPDRRFQTANDGERIY